MNQIFPIVTPKHTSLQNTIMSSSSMTYHRAHNRSGNAAHAQSVQRLSLEIQYTDEKHDIELYTKVRSPPTITIRQITEEILEFLYLDDIPPEDVRLAGFRRNGSYCQLNIRDTQKIIREVDITDGCILYFVPTPTAAPPKLCRLIIVGPDEVEKLDYEWYRAKTTLAMLLEYVIKKFSLELVERERIHLITIVDELDFWSYSDRRLSEFQLHNGMSVYVKIIPPLPLTTLDESKDVHVQCTCDRDKFNIDVPKTETVEELIIKIEKRFVDRKIIDFELHNDTNDELNLNDSDRTLESYGIKAGQTISATFRLIKRNAESSVVNKQSEASTKSSPSLNTKQKHKKVTVMCKFPSQNPESFTISVTKTVNELIKEIENRTHNQRLVISEMSSDNIQIDFNKDKSRCLADFGLKQDDIINVIMIDRSPIHSSIVSKRSPSSPKADKSSKAHSTKRNPMGLDNLGNSCYMNSALQCLAHVPQLTNMFLESIRHAHMDDDGHTDNDWNPYDQVGDVTGAYAELLWYLSRCDQTDDIYDSFKPSRIKENIGNKDSRFAKDDQQDAQEFMTFFLDVIHEELKAKDKNLKNTIIQQLFFGKITSTITCTACNKEESTTHPISFLSIPLNRQERRFYITFISKKGEDKVYNVETPISARVEHVVDDFTRSYDRPSLFHYILAMIPDGELDFKTPLSEIPTDELIFIEQEDPSKNHRPQPLQLPMKRSTLEDCLKDFFSREELEDGWTCQQKKCQKKTAATKQFKLSTLPIVLIIQFKRFSHENGLHQKVETLVEYPIKGLNLNKFLPSLEEEAIYDLVAVSNHMGSVYGGHYIAYARNSISNKTEWYKFDDSCVTLVKPQDYEYDIVSRNAYLLFYIKRDIETSV